MNDRTALLVAVGGLCLLGILGLLARPAPPVTDHERATIAPVALEPLRPSLPRLSPSPEPPGAADPPPDDVTALAALIDGHLLLRCFVGDDLQTTAPFDWFEGSVRDGWYHRFTKAAEGSHRHRLDTTPFTVHWTGGVPGTVTPCTVERHPMANLAIEVVDADGEPVPDATVYVQARTCPERTDGTGRASCEAVAEEPVPINAYRPPRSGTARLGPLPSEAFEAVRVVVTEGSGFGSHRPMLPAPAPPTRGTTAEERTTLCRRGETLLDEAEAARDGFHDWLAEERTRQAELHAQADRIVASIPTELARETADALRYQADVQLDPEPLEAKEAANDRAEARARDLIDANCP